jgi:hypothetical protein
MPEHLLSRRTFITAGIGSGLAVLLGATRFGHRGAHSRCGARTDAVDHGPHPTPRPGIDASHVLKADQLKDAPNAIPAFDEVRQIPEIVDGIRCHCGCATDKTRYSLLSCYEGDGMARECHTCQGQGRMAFRLHKEGKSLAEIRDAIDAKYD